MKKRILRLTILIAILAGLVMYKDGLSIFFNSPTAQAVGDLSVDWGVLEGNPIFVVSNMVPGDDESRSVTVNNDAASSRPVSVRGIKTSESGILASAFSFVISEGGSDIYGGTSLTGPKTLQDFFTESAAIDGIFLSNLASGASTIYTFTATFNTQSGNEFQDRQLIFDLKIGIIVAVPIECSLITFSGNPIFGTEKRDILQGTPGNDLIIALEENDIIVSGDGDDCIVGGTGNDSILAGNGNDIIAGGAGKDSIRSEAGNDAVQGEAGIDSIWGGPGDDIISGGDDQDSIYGEGDNDQIRGNNGNDSLNGGAGNDTIIGDAGVDSINGYTGIDTCDGEMKLSCEF